MPVYEYACDDCDALFEELVRSADAEVHCPECDGENVRRKPSVFSAQSAAPAVSLPMGGCGRCGNPNGPCNL